MKPDYFLEKPTSNSEKLQRGRYTTEPPIYVTPGRQNERRRKKSTIRFSNNMESYFESKHPVSFGGVDNFRKHLDRKFTRKQNTRLDAQTVCVRILYTNPYARTSKDE